MKKLFASLFLIAACLLAQSPTSVQQSASRLDSGLIMQTVAASATTMTISPSAGQSVYIYQIDFSNCQDATGISAAASPTFVTTTNLGGATTGTSLSWTIGSGGATAGSCPQSFSVSYPTGLKSTIPGTAVTIITPTFITHQTVRVTVTYAFAP